MKDLTIIIPIVDISTDTKKQLLINACKSADDSKIVIVGPQATIDAVKLLDLGKDVNKIQYIVNNDNTSYPAQVNFAVDKVKTKYFSVLESDDVYTDIWFKNVQKQIEFDTEEIFAYFPLTEVIDFNTNEIIGYSNEANWATSFSEQVGFLDLASAQDYFNYNVSGAVFKTDDFKEVGKLKASMKIVFWIEFIFRALHRGKKIYVIPKIGCYHYVNRDGSLTSTYKNEISEKEADWWIDLAKKEYFFPQDRNKTYEE